MICAVHVKKSQCLKATYAALVSHDAYWDYQLETCTTACHVVHTIVTKKRFEAQQNGYTCMPCPKMIVQQGCFV